MNRTLQIQLILVGASLLVLVVVAFVRPSYRAREVRFDQEADTVQKDEMQINRLDRQNEIVAEHRSSARSGAIPPRATPPPAANEPVHETQPVAENGGEVLMGEDVPPVTPDNDPSIAAEQELLREQEAAARLRPAPGTGVASRRRATPTPVPVVNSSNTDDLDDETYY